MILLKRLSIISILIVGLSTIQCDFKKDAQVQSQSMSQSSPNSLSDVENITKVSKSTNTITERFVPPKGFTRTPLDENSFGHYLRSLKLKPEGALVKYYNGTTKPNRNVYTSVVDLDIGTKDLHQCADAVMRLRAEYLWTKGQYNQIHFNFTNGHRVEYSEWMQGKRMRVVGNKTAWKDGQAPSNTYDDLWNYLELIFMYAGTASLEKELKSVSLHEAEIGDVLIQGGHPGHAVILVDKASNKITGQNLFIIAQSYMPAQELQILLNPINIGLGPWYTLEGEEIQTPEWQFGSDNLRRFVE